MDIIAAICILLAIIVIIICFYQEDKKDKFYEETIKHSKQWHDSTRQFAAKTIISEACLLKACQEMMKNNVDGIKYADRWIDKREELIKEIERECEERGNADLGEVFQASRGIAEMIFSGELDVNRD